MFSKKFVQTKPGDTIVQLVVQSHHTVSEAKSRLGKLHRNGEAIRIPIDGALTIFNHGIVDIGLADLLQKIVSNQPLILPLQALSRLGEYGVTRQI